MNKFLITGFLLCLVGIKSQANETPSWQQRTIELLPTMLQNIEENYAYADNKNINWSCLKERYTEQAQSVQDRNDTVLFFEYLLMEFADSHMTLNTNIQDSYRLHSPLAVKKVAQQFFVDDFWQSQLLPATGISIGAELLTINGKSLDQVIEEFPTRCLDKSQPKNQQWIINKTLAGKYSKPRIIELEFNGKRKSIDLDQLQYRQTKSPLITATQDNIGIITINNSLGQTELIHAFDEAINQLADTQGVVLDLRNTINGGDSYIARALMGRFIEQDQAYQKHRFYEQREGGPKVDRVWTEYVVPRLPTYKKPLVVLVNRWTGSMGEGLTIGLHGMHRAHVLGSKMAGLLGAVYSYPLAGMGFGYQLPAEQLFHIDGTPREAFKPDTLVKPDNKSKDAPMDQAIIWLQNQHKNKQTH